MSAFRFIHAADIHLDSPLHRLDRYDGAPVDDIRRSTRRALENLVDLAIEEEASFVVLTGDLYDGDWRDYNTGLFFISCMNKLREMDIPVFIVAGNHDAASKITRTLRLPEGISLLSADRPETRRLDNLDVAVHGQSFSTPVIKNDLSAEYPPPIPGFFNIGMLHTALTGRTGHEPYAPCNIDGLRSRGYDYWALGHVHNRETVSQDPLVVFPGNIQGRHIKETGAKGCMLVTVDDRGQPRTTFKPLDVVRWFLLETDASRAASGYDLVDQVNREVEVLLEENKEHPLVLRLQIKGASRAHEELASDVEKWTNELRSSALEAGGGRIWIEKVVFGTTPSFDVKRLKGTSGALGELIQTLKDIRSDPHRMQGLAAVLEDLNQKLPIDAAWGEKAFSPEDPSRMIGLLEQVQSMLIRRLVKREEDE